LKIVLTGVTGFIAQSLAKRLVTQNNEVVAIVRPHSDISSIPEGVESYVDSGDTVALQHFFETFQPEGVIHLASLFLAQHQTEDLEALVSSNILFGTRLLEVSAKNDVLWFINTGTFWQHYEDEAYNPVNLYAATKQAFEDIAKYYYETTDLNFVTLKLNDTFGEGDTRKKIFNLWGSLIESGESLGMSPGEQLINMSYIENIIDAYIQMIENLQDDRKGTLKGQSFAVGADEVMTLKALAEVYETVVEKRLSIEWGGRPYRNREVMVPWTKGKPVPNWFQAIPLEEAIARVVQHKGKVS
jgi:CDP-paratose synthetase